MGNIIHDWFIPTPDLLSGTDSKVRTDNLKGIGLLAVSILSDMAAEVYPEVGLLFNLVSLGLLFAAVIVFMHTFWQIGIHDKVCKALAGLERHQYHCAEDLVFHIGGMDWDLAEQIVNGAYDGLLMDKTTCIYIH